MLQREIDEIVNDGKRRSGLALRKIELNRLGIAYVVNRDAILKSQGLDPVIDAAEYEQRRRRGSKFDRHSSTGKLSFSL